MIKPAASIISSSASRKNRKSNDDADNLTPSHSWYFSFHFISIYLSIKQELQHKTYKYKWWTTRPFL